MLVEREARGLPPVVADLQPALARGRPFIELHPAVSSRGGAMARHSCWGWVGARACMIKVPSCSFCPGTLGCRGCCCKSGPATRPEQGRTPYPNPHSLTLSLPHSLTLSPTLRVGPWARDSKSAWSRSSLPSGSRCLLSPLILASLPQLARPSSSHNLACT